MSDRGSVFDGGGGSSRGDEHTNDLRSDVALLKREVQNKMQHVLAEVEAKCKECTTRIGGMSLAAGDMKARDEGINERLNELVMREEVASARYKELVSLLDAGDVGDGWGRLTKSIEFLERDSSLVQEGIRTVQEESDNIKQRINTARETRVR